MNKAEELRERGKQLGLDIDHEYALLCIHALERASIQGDECRQQVLEACLQGAKGSRISLPRIVEHVASVLQAYGLQSDQSSRVVDVLFGTITEGAVREPELQDVLLGLADIMARLGIPMKNVAKCVAVTTAKGVKAKTLLWILYLALPVLFPEDGEA